MLENAASFASDYAADIVPVILVGIGLYLVIWYKGRPMQPASNWANPDDWWQLQQRRFNSWSQAAGKNLSLPRFLLISAGCALGCGFGLMIVVKLGVVAVLGGLLAAFIPYLSLNVKRSKIQNARGKAWPHVVDNLISGVRAGMSLGETLTKVATSVPPSLQTPFAHFVLDYHARGNLDGSLAMLKNELADPIADRIIEALRLAAQVGGNDLVALLEDLGSMIRAEERTRAEILARQSWTVTGARLAAVAPWLILAMLLAKDQTLEIYATPTGGVILTSGAVVSVVAYLLMLRFGRLNRVPRMMGN